MALESYCAACTYLSENGSGGKYWCERKGEDHYATDSKCYSFCEAYSRSNSCRQNMYDYSQGSSSGCYLTTIMCHILGYPDNNYYLNTLRKFRDNVMKNNQEYIPLLITYDIIGPTIAYELAHDKDNKEIATVFFEKYIVKSVEAIEEQKEKEAINIYKAMTETLADKYVTKKGIININNIDATKYNKETLGHARVRKIISNH